MKAIVTGAAGFIGSHLSEHLVHAGHTVVGIDVFTDYYPRDRKEQNLTRLRSTDRFTLVETALADTDWDRLLDGVTWIFHLAVYGAYSWQTDVEQMMQTNVVGTANLLEAAFIVGVEALARWTHPTRGPIPPVEFIPAAEANGDDHRDRQVRAA